MDQSDSQHAREQLLLARGASGNGDAISRANRAGDGAYTLAIGVAIALFLLAVVYLFPMRIVWVSIAVTVGYLTVIAGASLSYVIRRRSSSLGWRRRFGVGLAVSMGFYAVGVAIAVSSTGLTTPLFWLPFAAVVATPLAVAGFGRGSR